jgi:hypothetical protein
LIHLISHGKHTAAGLRQALLFTSRCLVLIEIASRLKDADLYVTLMTFKTLTLNLCAILQRFPTPPIPDLRFEISFLLSIKPFLTPFKQQALPEQSLSSELKQDVSMSRVPEHDIFSGQVQVQWRQVIWVILRDQVGFF